MSRKKRELKGHSQADKKSKTYYAIACPKCGTDISTTPGGDAKCTGSRCNVMFNSEGIIKP